MANQWLSDDDLLHSLAGLLGEVVTETADLDKWRTFIPRASAAAKNQIEAALYARGFSSAEVADLVLTTGWARVAEFHHDLALYWLGVYAHALFKDGELQMLEKLNRAAELAGAVIVFDGAVLTPDATAAASTGVLRVREEFDAAQSRWPGEQPKVRTRSKWRWG